MAEVDVWLEPVAKNEGEAVELLQQLFELEESQARELVASAPCLVRNNVPDHLAKLVAKAMQERGIEVKLVPALLTASLRPHGKRAELDEVSAGEPAEQEWDDGSVDTPLTGPEGSLASKRAPPLSAKEAAKRRAAMDKEAGRPARKKAAKASAPGGRGVLVAVALVAVVVSIGSLVWWATDSPPPPVAAVPLSAAETDRVARQLLRREDKANAADWLAGGGELCRLDPSLGRRLVERLRTAGAESVDVAGYIAIAETRQMQNVIVTVGSADAADVARVARETVGEEETDDGSPRATVEQGREYVVVKLSRY